MRVVRLHDFRHGCLSVLLGLGVAAEDRHGDRRHSTIEMTMNVYGRVILDEKRAALERLNNVLEEKK